jgi:chromodomain-helicase-DNA-binding protein 1
MKFLRRILERSTPVTNFRIASQVKAVQNWKCQWAAKEDALLLIGVDKHGHGAWYPVRDDPELGLTDKLFLDENKPEKKVGKAEGATKDIPGAVHLNRRTDYLINVLREEHRKPGILDILSGKTAEAPPKDSKNRLRVGSTSKASTLKKVANGDNAPREKKKRLSGDRPDQGSPKVKKVDTASKDATKSVAKKPKREEPMSDYESMDEAELKVFSVLVDSLTSNRRRCVLSVTI